VAGRGGINSMAAVVGGVLLACLLGGSMCSAQSARAHHHHCRACFQVALWRELDPVSNR
jgi:hypothetical protein